MAEEKKVKLVKCEAVLDSAGVKLSKKETGTLRLWGIDFECDKGKATAMVDEDIVKSMKAAGKVK